VDAQEAVIAWKLSAPHNAVILERAPWGGGFLRTVGYMDAHWQAMGVGVAGHHAYVWFGKDPDTAG